jgi:para-nitrobenzyl esterase
MASLWIWVDRRARLGVGPVYAYLYDHPAPAPVNGGVGWGTFHTSEVPYVFGNLNRERRAYTDADTQVSEQLQARWLSFMEAGDPNQSGLPQWKRVEPGVQAVMALGDRAAPIAPVSTPERMAAFQRFVADGGRLSAL